MLVVKRIAAYTRLSSTFTSYIKILVGNCNFFLPPCKCHSGVPIGIPGNKFGHQKTRIMGLPGSEDNLMIE